MAAEDVGTLAAPEEGDVEVGVVAGHPLLVEPVRQAAEPVPQLLLDVLALTVMVDPPDHEEVVPPHVHVGGRDGLEAGAERLEVLEVPPPEVSVDGLHDLRGE